MGRGGRFRLTLGLALADRKGRFELASSSA
jgi:hypothetical protein